MRLTAQEAHIMGIENKRGQPITAKVKRPKVSQKSVGEETLALHIKAAGLPAPEREHRFHPERRWRFDFAWPSLMIAVECDGGAYSNGRHNRGPGYEEDCIKLAEATILGWSVLRFTTGQVKQGMAINMISRLMEARK